MAAPCAKLQNDDMSSQSRCEEDAVGDVKHCTPYKGITNG